MNTTLWILQGIAGALFLMAGFTKLATPLEKLAVKMPWVNDFSPLTVRFIGFTQLAAAIGLILPMLLGIAPVLTPIAAIGLALTMVFAAVYHIRKKEFPALKINSALFILVTIIAVGRFIYP